MSKIIKNTSLYTIGHIIPKAAQFLLLPLYTRYLTPSDYGIIQSMTVLSTILTIFFSMAVERSIPRLYFDQSNEKEKKDYLGTVFVILLGISTLMLIVVLIGRSLVSQIFVSIPFYPYYLYAILTVYFTVFGLIPKTYLQVSQKAGKFILISLAEFFIMTGFIIYFIVFAGRGASGMLLGKLVKSIIFIPLFIIIISKIINFKFRKEIAKESLSYSWPMVPGLLSAFVLNLSDRIFIERYFTLKDVGLYSLSYKLSQVLLIFTQGFNKAYEPIFFKLANNEKAIVAKRKLFKYNRVYIIVLITGALLISLFSKEFVLLLDAKYKSTYKLVPIILIGILVNSMGGLFNRSIYQSKKTKQIMYLVLSSAVLNIMLNFVLVPRYGSYGAAYATTVTFTFFFFIKYFYSKKCYFVPFAWKEMMPYFIIFIILSFLFNYIELGFGIELSLKISILIILLAYMSRKYKSILLGLLKKGNK
jgi:O-antigen/teichoic acid export membrane protein